jgi:uncharacterized membrane protein YbaN (DUF454 family)
MPKHVKKILLIIVGTLSILLGIAGLILPIIQGWFFLGIGIVLLSISIPVLGDFRRKHTARWPKIHQKIEDAEKWVLEKIGEI